MLDKIAQKLEDEYLHLIKQNKNKVKDLIQNYFNDKFKATVKENLRKELYTCFEDYDKEAELLKGNQDLLNMYSNYYLYVIFIILKIFLFLFEFQRITV